MKALINGAWVDIPVGQVDNGVHAKQRAVVEDLETRAKALRTSVSATADGLACSSVSSATRVYSHSSGATVAGISPSFYCQQGGCLNDTKDTMFYYVRPNDETGSGHIFRAPLTFDSSGAVTGATPDKASAALSLYHGNDMTYHAPSGNLYIASMYGASPSYRIDVVRASDLVQLDSIYASTYTSMLAYDPVKDLFVLGNGTGKKYLYRMNDAGELVYLKNISYDSPAYAAGLTSQGICCDSAFIYHSFYGSPSRVEIYDWLGNYHGYMSASWSYEVEWIDKTSKHGFLGGFHTASKAYVYKFSQS